MRHPWRRVAPAALLGVLGAGLTAQGHFALPDLRQPTGRIRDCLARLGPLAEEAGRVQARLGRTRGATAAPAELRDLARRIAACANDAARVDRAFALISARLERERRVCDAVESVTARHVRDSAARLGRLQAELAWARDDLRRACSPAERAAARCAWQEIYECYRVELERQATLGYLCDGQKCQRRGGGILMRGYAAAAEDARQIYARLRAEAELLELAASLRWDRGAKESRLRELLRVVRPLSGAARNVKALESQSDLLLELSQRLDADAGAVSPLLGELDELRRVFARDQDPEVLRREVEAIEREVDALLEESVAPHRAAVRAVDEPSLDQRR
ncbi:MAG: hypothetical protein AAF628_09265 [Planctomycetota bacterium]